MTKYTQNLLNEKQRVEQQLNFFADMLDMTFSVDNYATIVDGLDISTASMFVALFEYYNTVLEAIDNDASI